MSILIAITQVGALAFVFYAIMAMLRNFGITLWFAMIVVIITLVVHLI